eukprot:COSAG01_NODE_493_length_16327_cov_5.632879_4_plen_526_part_00
MWLEADDSGSDEDESHARVFGDKLTRAIRDGDFLKAFKLVKKPGVDMDDALDELSSYGGITNPHLLSMAQRLVDWGADVNARAPLHNAVKTGNTDLIEFLIRKGAQLDRVDEDGCTPLHRAVLSIDIAGHRALLANSERGFSCGMDEYLRRRGEVALLLVQRGANRNAEVARRYTKLETRRNGDTTTHEWQGKTAMAIADDKGLGTLAKQMRESPGSSHHVLAPLSPLDSDGETSDYESNSEERTMLLTTSDGTTIEAVQSAIHEETPTIKRLRAEIAGYKGRGCSQQVTKTPGVAVEASPDHLVAQAYATRYGVFVRPYAHAKASNLDEYRTAVRDAKATMNKEAATEAPPRSSQHKGVSWAKRKGMWQAAIKVRKRVKHSGEKQRSTVHLGYFADEEQAATTYKEAKQARQRQRRGDNWTVDETARVAAIEQGIRDGVKKLADLSVSDLRHLLVGRGGRAQVKETESGKWRLLKHAELVEACSKLSPMTSVTLAADKDAHVDVDMQAARMDVGDLAAEIYQSF